MKLSTLNYMKIGKLFKIGKIRYRHTYKGDSLINLEAEFLSSRKENGITRECLLCLHVILFGKDIHSLTQSWSSALLEKVSIVQSLKNFPAFDGN
jgi:hypothetical protein